MKAELAAGRTNGGQQWEVLPVASNQNWGAASTALVRALTDEHAIAIVALDRDSAHLAEQLALKLFVPVIAVSDDTALTSTNVPWIFRVPGSTSPAAALQLVNAALLRSGANAESLRNALASGTDLAGFTFQSNGELRGR
jgi:branched-chain amino acid transport system substrate-binding protein